MRPVKFAYALFVCLALLSSSAFAWSTKEHILITRCAIRDLLARPDTPEAMKQWLREAQPNLGTAEDERAFLMEQRIGIYPRGVDGLAFWSVMPDLISDAAAARDKKVAPFNVTEQQLHYVDMEYLFPEGANAAPHTAPAIADIPRDMADPRWQKAGMLPFRIEQLHKELVTQLRAGRLNDKPGQFPRDEHATKSAGMLAHYAADNWMPMHATADYQAYSFFPDVEKSKKPKVHFDMEFRMTDDDKADYPTLRAELWQSFAAALAQGERPQMTADVWTTSLGISSRAIQGVPMIGKAAQVAYLDKSGQIKDFDADAFFHYTFELDGSQTTILRLKAASMVKATHWIQTLWLSAWSEAHADAK